MTLSEIEYLSLLNRERLDFPARVDAKSRLFITGAAGSIGSVLVSTCLNLGAQVIAFDNREEGLYNLIQRHGDSFTPVLGDIRDQSRLHEAIKAHAPSLVIHAAAFKHVSLMQQFAGEAVKTNVFGTLNVLNACADLSVKAVCVSTDKAVEPISVMGAAKRICELLIAGKNACAVRLFNVLGSSGSVLPAFLRAREQGLALMVSSPIAERYFLTPAEAAECILAAASLSAGGEIFVPKAVAPTKIIDIARALTAHGGRVEIGALASGEKVTEKLIADIETPTSTACDLLYKVIPTPPKNLLDMVMALKTLEGQRLQSAMLEIARL